MGGVYVSWISSTFAVIDPPPFSPEPNYYGIFTKRIYDQEEVLNSSTGQLPQEIDEACVQSVKLKKEQQLGEKLIDKMRKKLTYLRDESNNDEKRIMWDNLLGNTSLLPFALMGCKCPHEFVLVTVGTIAKAVGGYIVSKYYDPPIVAQLKRQTKELEDEINHLYKSLESERISEFEKQYVQKKRFLDPFIRCEIEGALIEGRNIATVFPLLQMFLRNSLLLPTAPKTLLGPNPQEDILELRQRFNRDTFFEGFSPQTKELLLKAAENIAYASISKDESSVPKRERLFFWGNPGCGKSTAAVKFAEFLGLPYYKPPLRSANELSQSNLEGVPRYRPDVNVGWLVEPLLAKMEENSGITYNNGFLIIDDFDRVLFSPQGAPALAFLLDYLDPEKKEMQHAYFRTPINIRRLNIIITSNKPIPGGDNSPQDTYAALRSRIKTIEFPDLEEVKYKGVLRDYLKELHQFYHLASWITLEYTENNRLIFKSTLSGTDIPEVLKEIDLSDHLVRNAASIRDRKQALQDVVMQHNSEIMEQAAQEYREAENLLTTNIPRAYELFQSSARKGKVESAYRLGQLHASLQHREDSQFYYEKASESNHPGALRELGKISEDVQKEKYLNRAADLGDGEAMSLLGDLHASAGEDEAAERFYARAVQVNYFEAKFGLASLKEKQRKFTEAKSLYFDLLERRLFVNDILPKIYKLGEEFEKIEGISTQNTNALECYRKTAAQGHVLSHVKIGLIPFWDSETHNEEQVRSVRFAAERDDPIAIAILGFLHLHGRGGVERNSTEAIHLFRRAKNSCLIAKYELAFRYWEGVGVQRNQPHANAYFSQIYQTLSTIRDGEGLKRFVYSTLQNQPYGMHAMYAQILGGLYHQGWGGCERNRETALFWTGIGARSGYKPGQQQKRALESCVIL